MVFVGADLSEEVSFCWLFLVVYFLDFRNKS